MKWIKLTAYSLMITSFIVGLGSCEKSDETKKTTTFQKSGIAMTGAQETPATPSPALGSLDINYVKGSKILSYKFSWSGLADTITGIHIHGLAPVGYAAGILQAITTVKNETVFPYRGGSYTGYLTVDGVVIKEESLLNALYYLNIHTKTYPNGEIRAQIKFD